MSFKKSVQNVVTVMQKRMENLDWYSDTNAQNADCNFKAKEENPDCKINYGKNMFAASKP